MEILGMHEQVVERLLQEGFTMDKDGGMVKPINIAIQGDNNSLNFGGKIRIEQNPVEVTLGYLVTASTITVNETEHDFLTLSDWPLMATQLLFVQETLDDTMSLIHQNMKLACDKLSDHFDTLGHVIIRVVGGLDPKPKVEFGKIFCIVGRGGSGKDTLARMIGEDMPKDLTEILMCTTRAKRDSEIGCERFNFTTEEDLLQLQKDGQVIEARSYDTANGLQSYFIKKFEPEKNMNYLITSEPPIGVKSLITHFGEEHVVVVYLDVSDKVLLTRAITRENTNQQHTNYEEICRRFISDKADFSAKIMRQFSNLRRINGNGTEKENLNQWKEIYNNAK